MTKSRLITASVIVLLALLVILQNTQPVTTRILIFSFTLSNAVLLALTFLIGLATGLLISLKKSNKSK